MAVTARAPTSCHVTVVQGGSDFGRDVTILIPKSGVPLDAVERALIAFALETTNGNRTRAARLVGLSRSALLYRMHKHRLNAAPDPSTALPAPAAQT